MLRPARIAAILLLLAAPAPAQPPNVVVFVADDHEAEALGA